MNFQKIEFELAAGKEDQLPESSFPEIVFCGKSNVGKSSLINKLANRKALARVSATPGKQRQLIFIVFLIAALWTCPAMDMQKFPEPKRNGGRIW